MKSKRIKLPFDPESYDTLERFVSFFSQAKLIRDTKPGKVLEIGVGNKTLINYLKNIGIDIVGCDINRDSKPDVVGDIRNIPMKDDSFDSVVAFEVLEHLSFRDFEPALKELKRVSKKYVIISLPYSSFLHFVGLFKMNLPFIGKQIINFIIRIPPFFRKFKKNKDHHWEMGYEGYSKRFIRKKLLKYFKIKRELNHPMNHYHYFFVLEK